MRNGYEGPSEAQIRKIVVITHSSVSGLVCVYLVFSNATFAMQSNKLPMLNGFHLRGARDTSTKYYAGWSILCLGTKHS